MLWFILGCSDYSVRQLCPTDANGFDIEEASVLQDAAGYPLMRDAIQFSHTTDHLEKGEYWRPIGVDVMVMLPVWFFYEYDDSYVLTVEIFDGSSPINSDSYKMSKAIVLESEEWEDIVLPPGAATAEVPDQMRAWAHFDFSNEIPLTGFFNDDYLVGVKWDESGLPAVGYSNFNLDCDKNWTYRGTNDDGWVHNSTVSAGNSCSWPMLRVNIEERVYNPDCEELGTAL